VPKDAHKILSFATPRIGALALTPEQKAAFEKIGAQERAVADGLEAFKKEAELRALARRWREEADAFEAEADALAARRKAAAGTAPEPKRIAPAPVKQGKQAERVRRFLTEARPADDLSDATVQRLMGQWISAENKRTGDNRPTPSVSVIGRARRPR